MKRRYRGVYRGPGFVVVSVRMCVQRKTCKATFQRDDWAKKTFYIGWCKIHGWWDNKTEQWCPTCRRIQAVKAAQKH